MATSFVFSAIENVICHSNNISVLFKNVYSCLNIEVSLNLLIFSYSTSENFPSKNKKHPSLCLLELYIFSLQVNVALLVASLLVYGQTIQLSRYVKRKEKPSNCECVNTESNVDKKGCQLLSLHI